MLPAWAAFSPRGGNRLQAGNGYAPLIRTSLNRWTLLVLMMLPACAWALSTDKDQPMRIEADRVELDDATGISTYRGNVKVTQGTLVITGDMMTIYSKNNEIRKVIMDGNPATYRQRPDGKEQDVRASSRRMEYYTDPEHIILLKQAEVNQQGDQLRSERIEYDVVNDQVKAGTDHPNERVHITIQPKNSKDKPESPAP
jgi:lipopolysaccharide export system protein LptA